METPITSARDCTLHNYHRPQPLYTELHHVVPKAWQAFWRPAGVKSSLWWPKTVPVCRTSHGNVHIILVQFMHEFAKTQVIPNKSIVGQKQETKIAVEGMTTWVGQGGNLLDLIANGLYGEI